MPCREAFAFGRMLWYCVQCTSLAVESDSIQTALYFIGNIVYKLYFHPLHKVPGPAANALSRIPYVRHLLAGSTAVNTKALHEEYGDVVRVSPNEVSFISVESAFTDIYGFRTGKLKGHPNMQKDPVWYAPPINGIPSILLAKTRITLAAGDCSAMPSARELWRSRRSCCRGTLTSSYLASKR